LSVRVGMRQRGDQGVRQREFFQQPVLVGAPGALQQEFDMIGDAPQQQRQAGIVRPLRPDGERGVTFLHVGRQVRQA